MLEAVEEWYWKQWKEREKVCCVVAGGILVGGEREEIDKRKKSGDGGYLEGRIIERYFEGVMSVSYPERKFGLPSNLCRSKWVQKYSKRFLVISC